VADLGPALDVAVTTLTARRDTVRAAVLKFERQKAAERLWRQARDDLLAKREETSAYLRRRFASGPAALPPPGSSAAPPAAS